MDFHKTKACQSCTIAVPLEKVHLYPLTQSSGQISCKYRFRIDENKVNTSKNPSCPYCGKDDYLSCVR
ncbi:hypothetical protein HYU21_03570 [Candidatus Woesearchaeota archaeon]|nr:hypothetical protein [Candidatus Woesearchaeota archaeon]